jgi:hypothetical protein
VPGVEPRPPPPVTIEGGRGWQLGDARGDVSGGDEPPAGPPGEPPGRGRRVGAVVLAAALGFGAATALAERRQSSLDDSPAGVLSLDVVGDQSVVFSSELVSAADGTPSLVASVELRNTGPAPVALESAELLGTGYRAEDVTGRRVGDRDRTTVRLLRPVRCDELAPPAPPGPLRVRAMTRAGPRTTDLRLDTPDRALSEDLAQAACGRSSPARSLVVVEPAAAVVDGSRARVTAELSNGSASPILLQELRVSAGLRIVALQDADGAEVPLPLALPPGDFDPPTEPSLGRGPGRLLVVVLEVEDCAQLRPPRVEDLYLPLLEATVTDVEGGLGDRDRRRGGFGGGGGAWGDRSVAYRLHGAACPPDARAEAQDPPAPSPGARPGSPFFTPD